MSNLINYMSIIKWEPFDDIDRFFEGGLFSPQFSKLGRDLAIDVYEEGGNIVAEMNLPGIDSDKVDISVVDHHLKVKGSREEEKERKEKNYYSKEIRRGSFERVVRIPDDVDADKATADYKDGVLKISLPKKEGEKAKKVKIGINK